MIGLAMAYYGPLKINDEPQALDAIGNGGRFILVGDQHLNQNGQQAFVDLMPSFERAHVRLIALELPPSMNSLLAKNQELIRKDMAAGLPQDQIVNNAAQRMNDYFTEHNQSYVSGNAQEATIDASFLYEATRHNMKVIGIDPRPDSPSYDARKQELIRTFPRDMTEQLTRLRTSLDVEAARNASAALDAAPPDSRMAIFYGRDHLTQENDPQTYPVVLGEALRRHGTVTTIDINSNGSPLPVTYEMNKAVGQDAAARAARDSRKPPVKINLSN